jgi:hypothetical protein
MLGISLTSSCRFDDNLRDIPWAYFPQVSASVTCKTLLPCPSQPASSLRQRARQASSAELAGIPWLALLDAADRHAAAAALQVSDADPGDRVCRHRARPATTGSAWSTGC